MSRSPLPFPACSEQIFHPRTENRKSLKPQEVLHRLNKTSTRERSVFVHQSPDILPGYRISQCGEFGSGGLGIRCEEIFKPLRIILALSLL